jgi:4-phytase / acid phosphatase
MIFVAHQRYMLLGLLLAVLCGSMAMGQTSPLQDESDLRAVIVIMRHGVRAPIESETRSGAYNAQPWPAWPTEPGVLTPHGAQALRLLADFYRMRYPTLLQSNSCEHPGLYVEANTTQRTIASAKALLPGLSPQCTVQAQYFTDRPNPLFSPSSHSAVDRQRVTDATLGRMANQPDWFTEAFARPLEKMHGVLTSCVGSGCDRSTPDFRTIRVQNGIVAPRDSRVEGPVTLGADFAENFLLEYTEGMPMSQVGWGRVSRANLDDLMQMNTQYHDFMLRTPYGAQVAASNLATHIRDTILSAASGNATPYQLGTTADRFILLDGHDSNLSWLGGLLHLDWLLPDQAFNATPPGSALVFEVHRSRVSGRATVQVLFISQTLDQIRDLRPLTGAERPSIAPIFVPGCSGVAPAYECTVEEFTRVVNSAIDNRFVVDFPKVDSPKLNSPKVGPLK